MFRDPLSERVIIGALIFVIVIVVGAQLYRCHIRRTSERVPVSPFRFGPYPAVPTDYPTPPTWEHEREDPKEY